MEERKPYEEYIEYQMAEEAYINATILKNSLRTKEEAFYFFASMNLLNAYIKKEYAGEDYRKRYIIKEYVKQALIQVIDNKIKGVDIYLDSDVAYIKLIGRQFSFHNVRITKELNDYKHSKFNKPQEWSGIRLQPICVTIYKEARKLNGYKN